MHYIRTCFNLTQDCFVWHQHISFYISLLSMLSIGFCVSWDIIFKYYEKVTEWINKKSDIISWHKRLQHPACLILTYSWFQTFAVFWMLYCILLGNSPGVWILYVYGIWELPRRKHTIILTSLFCPVFRRASLSVYLSRLSTTQYTRRRERLC